jgi:hypothetical protein
MCHFCEIGAPPHDGAPDHHCDSSSVRPPRVGPSARDTPAGCRALLPCGRSGPPRAGPARSRSEFRTRSARPSARQPGVPAASALIRCTTLLPVPNSRATLKMPLPLASAARMAASLAGSIRPAERLATPGALRPPWRCRQRCALELWTARTPRIPRASGTAPCRPACSCRPLAGRGRDPLSCVRQAEGPGRASPFLLGARAGFSPDCRVDDPRWREAVFEHGTDADRENGPAARSFAADAHDCIMVRSEPTEYKFAVRDPHPMASSPPIITQTYSRRHQTQSFEERPISSPSSLRVLRRQGAAKHKPR